MCNERMRKMDTNEILDYMVDASFYHPAPEFDLLYHALGLTEEVGEIEGKIKKAMRDHGWNPITDPTPPLTSRTKILTEMGDALFYYCLVLHALGASFDEVMEAFRFKKEGRVERGTLHGEGDDR